MRAVGLRPSVMQVITSLNLGGAEEVALSLTEGLYQDCDFTVFAVMGAAPTRIGLDMQRRLRELQVPVYSGTRLDMKAGGALHAGQRLSRLLRRLRPEVVHLHTDIPEATYAASALLTSGRPGPRVLRTIHNTTLWPKWRRIGGWVERRLSSAEVVAVSPQSLTSLQMFRQERGLAGLPAAQCQVIYNGVAALPEVSAPRPPGPVRVLFAGRFEPQKGADLLPAILKRAAELTSAPVSVELYGHGSLGNALERWAAENELRWPVSISEPVPQLAARLPDFDVVLMPSRFEGLAMLCLEAAMAGAPVVGTDIPGLRELFGPDDELLAPPEDVEGLATRLARVIDAPERYRARALERVPATEAVFGRARMVESYRQLYQAPLGRFASSTAVQERA